MIGAYMFGQQGGDAVRLARRLFIQALGRVGDDEVSRMAHCLTEAYIARWRLAGEEVIRLRASCRGSPSILSAKVMVGHRFSPEESARFVDLFFAYRRRAAPVLLMLARPHPRVLQRVVGHLGLHEIGGAMRTLIQARFLAPIAAGEPAASSAPFRQGLAAGGAGFA